MTTSSPNAPLVFAAIVEGNDGIEAAALAADPLTLEVHQLFTGRIDPTDGSKPDVGPDAPRSMLHHEFALGLGSALDGRVLVAWRVRDLEDRLGDLLATGGRTVEFEDRIDLRSAALPVLEAAGVTADWLDEAATAFGLPASGVRALDQARTALAVLQRTRTHAGLGEEWARLAGDERQIAELIIQRLGAGRAVYGQWNLGDARVYEREAIEEAADGFQYAAAALIRARRDTHRPRRYRIAYLATGLSADHPTVTAAMRRMLGRRVLALHPEPLVAQLRAGGMSDLDARMLLVEAADEVCAIGSASHPAVVEAMALAHAHRRTITFAPVEVVS